MLQPEQSPARRVTYDSSEGRLQWRCQLHILRKPKNVIIISAISLFLAAVLQMPPFYWLALFLSVVVGSLIQIALTIKKRTRGPRICSTTISADGLTDSTPDSNKSFTWRQVQSVEIYRGDIYFPTWTAGVFIPASAFADEAEANDFYQQATTYWQAGRSKKGRNLKMLPSSTSNDIAPADVPPMPSYEDLLAEDESVWIALEQEHKKQKEAGKRPEDGKKKGVGE
jgi:hypothetical protein